MTGDEGTDDECERRGDAAADVDGTGNDDVVAYVSGSGGGLCTALRQ